MATATENESALSVSALLSGEIPGAEAAYRELVLNLARGSTEGLSVARVRTMLGEANRTRDDLQRHVRRARSRQQALRDLEAAKALSDQVRQIEGEQLAIHSRHMEFAAQFERDVAPLFEQGQALETQRKGLLNKAGEIRGRASKTLEATSSPSNVIDMAEYESRSQQEQSLTEAVHHLRRQQRQTLDGATLKPGQPRLTSDKPSTIADLHELIRKKRLDVERMESRDAQHGQADPSFDLVAARRELSKLTEAAEAFDQLGEQIVEIEAQQSELFEARHVEERRVDRLRTDWTAINWG